MSEYNRPLRWTISRLPFCSPTSFFSPKGRYPELFNLKDSLKHRAHPTTTPESEKDVRPPSTKSRNEVRLDMQSSRSLLWYLKIRATHAKGPLECRCPDMETGLYHTKPLPYQAVSSGPYQILTSKGLLVSPRPKSAVCVPWVRYCFSLICLVTFIERICNCNVKLGTWWNISRDEAFSGKREAINVKYIYACEVSYCDLWNISKPRSPARCLKI